MQTPILELDGISTLFCACVVLFAGKYINRWVPVLNKYHIPTPVTGGLAAAVLLAIAYSVSGFQVNFTKGLATSFMLMFFASIGLSADFKKLAAGGKGLILLLLVASVMVVIQNVVGTGLASVFGIDHRLGLVTGSITLVGGHGTGGAWGGVFANAGLESAPALAFAAATYGLIAGGIVGGPVSEYLIRRHKLTANPVVEGDEDDSFENSDKLVPIRATSVTEGFICLMLSVFAGIQLHKHLNGLAFMPNLPTFVYVLFSGIILRALLTNIFNRELKEVTIDVLGNVSLSIYLAISLLSIKIWTVADLALPGVVILAIQTVIVIVFSIYVTFNVMGRDYDAAVICAGQCGFSLGATPTAIANMQSVTSYFGPSHKAFLLIPLVGSFFIDIVNSFVISFFANF